MLQLPLPRVRGMMHFTDDEIVRRIAFWNEECEKHPRLIGEPGLAKVTINESGHRLRRDRIPCISCGDYILHRSMQAHMLSHHCIIRQEVIKAVKENYIYTRWTAGVSSAAWAKPFIKSFRTGEDWKSGQKVSAAPRWWAKDWWWDIYESVKLLPDRIDLLEKIKDLWEVGDMDGINNVIGIIELQRDGRR